MQQAPDLPAREHRGDACSSDASLSLNQLTTPLGGVSQIKPSPGPWLAAMPYSCYQTEVRHACTSLLDAVFSPCLRIPTMRPQRRPARLLNTPARVSKFMW